MPTLKTTTTHVSDFNLGFKLGFWEMGSNKFSCFVLFCWVFLILCLKPGCDGSVVDVNFLKAPPTFSNVTNAIFVFEINGDTCRNCGINCKLDDGSFSECEAREVSYTNLKNGNHILMVCTNGSQGDGCASYKWIVETRSDFINLMTHVPARQFIVDDVYKTLRVTNKYRLLRVCLYFSQPVLNSSEEVKNSLDTKIWNSLDTTDHATQGELVTINTTKNLGNRRFSFRVKNPPDYALIKVSLDSNFIISIQGNRFSTSVDPVTFLYDRLRSDVQLSTPVSKWTTENVIPIAIYFKEPVLGFNPSSISVQGGNLIPDKLPKVNENRVYSTVKYLEIQANSDADVIAIKVLENIAGDVAGNTNLESINTLRVWHYSGPKIANVMAIFTTSSFGATSLAAGLLTMSTASLQSVGAFAGPTFDPATDVFNMACHIQLFALSRWVADTLPVYSGFARRLQWSIPYFSLPWESKHRKANVSGPHTISRLYISNIHDTGIFKSEQSEIENLIMVSNQSGWYENSTATDYNIIANQSSKHDQYCLDPEHSNGWRVFNNTMLWLAAIGGSLMLFHALHLCILKIRNKKQRGHGALLLQRCEIFLILYAIPSICKASTALIKARKRTVLGVMVAILLLGLTFLLLLLYFLFLLHGIIRRKLLQYDAEAKPPEESGCCSWWNKGIFNLILGPGDEVAKWTWTGRKKIKSIDDTGYVTIFGPLFEKYKGPHAQGNQPVETLRVYYPLLKMAGSVYLAVAFIKCSRKDQSSITPTIIALSITSLQLFFLLLLRPYIKKRSMLFEIIMVSFTMARYAICLPLAHRKYDSPKDTTTPGILTVIPFLMAYVFQMLDAWNTLYALTVESDLSGNKSFFSGLKTSLIGFLHFFNPQEMVDRHLIDLPGDGGTGPPQQDTTVSSGTMSTDTTGKPLTKPAQ